MYRNAFTYLALSRVPRIYNRDTPSMRKKWLMCFNLTIDYHLWSFGFWRWGPFHLLIYGRKYALPECDSRGGC